MNIEYKTCICGDMDKFDDFEKWFIDNKLITDCAELNLTEYSRVVWNAAIKSVKERDELKKLVDDLHIKVYEAEDNYSEAMAKLTDLKESHNLLSGENITLKYLLEEARKEIITNEMIECRNEKYLNE